MGSSGNASSSKEKHPTSGTVERRRRRDPAALIGVQCSSPGEAGSSRLIPGPTSCLGCHLCTFLFRMLVAGQGGGQGWGRVQNMGGSMLAGP